MPGRVGRGGSSIVSHELHLDTVATQSRLQQVALDIADKELLAVIQTTLPISLAVGDTLRVTGYDIDEDGVTIWVEKVIGSREGSRNP